MKHPNLCLIIFTILTAPAIYFTTLNFNYLNQNVYDGKYKNATYLDDDFTTDLLHKEYEIFQTTADETPVFTKDDQTKLMKMINEKIDSNLDWDAQIKELENLLENLKGGEEERTSLDYRSILNQLPYFKKLNRDSIRLPPEKNYPANNNDHKKLNILILYPDDWRHDELGTASPIARTPNLNDLAREGIRFTHNCVTTSICWMSRATLFTGKYTSEHQSVRLKCPHFARPDLWKKYAWPPILQKEAGYYVGHVGKWQYYNDPSRERMFDWSRFYEGRHWYGEFSGADKCRDDAIEFLNVRPKDKPFALTVAFYPPKPVGTSFEPGDQFQPAQFFREKFDNITIKEPYNMTEAYNALPDFLKGSGKATNSRWKQRYGSPHQYQESMKNYWALVAHVDNACGYIIEELKRQDIYDNTMIIFTTDNGMFHGSHGLAGKWYPYQESIRVPLIIHDPRMPKDRKGTLDDSFTLNVDLAETILGAAGVTPPASMQGRDISDLYLPKASEKNSIFSNPWRNEFFYEYPDLDPYGIPPSTALVRKDWKYINWPYNNYEQLFHVEVDPLELNDLHQDAKSQKILQEMKARHDELRDQITKPKEEQMVCELFKAEDYINKDDSLK